MLERTDHYTRERRIQRMVAVGLFSMIVDERQMLV
jgi:hypothetical protein